MRSCRSVATVCGTLIPARFVEIAVKNIVERLQNVSMVSVLPNLADINGTRALVRTFEIGYTERGETSRMDVDLNEIYP